MSETETPVPASDVEPEATSEKLTEEQRLEALHAFGLSEHSADTKLVPVDLLRPAARNPRRGAVAEVAESLRQFGQHRPVVVQHSTGQVIVGNHMLKAALVLGWDEIAALIVDDDDEQALKRAVADNATGDRAGWDEQELAEVMQEIGPVPGLEQDEIDKLIAKLTPEEDKVEPTYPLVPRLNEKYDYVVVFAENETDWTWLQTRFELRREKSYKSTAVATSHVITVSRLQELLGES